MPEHAAAGDTSSFEVFSGDLEAWHNDAHIEIGMAVHHNLMNPRTNVRRPEFWRLHYFINDRFVDELHNSAAGAAPATTVATLEKNKSVAAAI